MNSPAPTGLDAALADSAATHLVHGCTESSTHLPDGYRVMWRTRRCTPTARLQAALFSPSPSGLARVCTARFTGALAVPAAARILAAAARYAPALADSPDACPRPASVASLLRYGHAEMTPEPGLLVHYGPVRLWLHRRRLQVAAGTRNRTTLALDGSCDAHSTARLADHILGEAGGGRRFAQKVSAELPIGAQALRDEWHPQAALVLLAAPADLTADPLGRSHSRRYRRLRHAVTARQPAWRVQNLYSDEGSTVALRITETTAVPQLFKHSVWIPNRPGSSVAGATITSVFRPCQRGCPHH